jgi:hypothetical protein
MWKTTVGLGWVPLPKTLHYSLLQSQSPASQQKRMQKKHVNTSHTCEVLVGFLFKRDL